MDILNTPIEAITFLMGVKRSDDVRPVFDICKEALLSRIARLPVNTSTGYLCPACSHIVNTYYVRRATTEMDSYQTFCPSCGQLLDWAAYINKGVL